MEYEIGIQFETHVNQYTGVHCLVYNVHWYIDIKIPNKISDRNGLRYDRESFHPVSGGRNTKAKRGTRPELTAVPLSCAPDNPHFCMVCVWGFPSFKRFSVLKNLVHF